MVGTDNQLTAFQYSSITGAKKSKSKSCMRDAMSNPPADYLCAKSHLEDSLTVIRYHGPNRPKDQSGLAALVDSDVVITTYNTLAKEFSDRHIFGKSSLLHDIEWYRIVLDEGKRTQIFR